MELTFKVKKSERGKRIDSFLHGKMSDWTHRNIKNAIDKKCVFVNGKNIFISGWNLKPGDVVLFKPLKNDMPAAGQEELARYHYVKVLFEDDSLLVVDKGAFIDYDTYVLQVNQYLKRKEAHRIKNFFPYLGQMHRLDKETSGILIFTKKKSANILSEQFRNHKIVKYYTALVRGAVEKDHEVIKDEIEKGKFEDGKKARIAEEGEGKESYTEYWVKERYANATLLRIQIKTGRTHQIRIHLSSRGYPVLGDKLYGVGAGSPRPLQKTGGQAGEGTSPLRIKPPKRHMLHAQQIEFWHPITKKKMKIESPLPEDMQKMIEILRES